MKTHTPTSEALPRRTAARPMPDRRVITTVLALLLGLIVISGPLSTAGAEQAGNPSALPDSVDQPSHPTVTGPVLINMVDGSFSLAQGAALLGCEQGELATAPSLTPTTHTLDCRQGPRVGTITIGIFDPAVRPASWSIEGGTGGYRMLSGGGLVSEETGHLAGQVRFGNVDWSNPTSAIETRRRREATGHSRSRARLPGHSAQP